VRVIIACPGSCGFGMNWSANRKLSPLGVNSGASWFCDWVRFRAPWCASLPWNLLILSLGALCCTSLVWVVRIKSQLLPGERSRCDEQPDASLPTGGD
jgi:hypothetical protein